MGAGKTEISIKECKTIVFVPGCTWLVCHVDKDEESGKNHVYIREIDLGLSEKKVIFWLDDKLLRNSYSAFLYWINDWNRSQEA